MYSTSDQLSLDLQNSFQIHTISLCISTHQLKFPDLHHVPTHTFITNPQYNFLQSHIEDAMECGWGEWLKSGFSNILSRSRFEFRIGVTPSLRSRQILCKRRKFLVGISYVNYWAPDSVYTYQISILFLGVSPSRRPVETSELFVWYFNILSVHIRMYW